ncbi:MAG: DUF134 domain-containing protein [Firmicutes bacterium]|nr:DUF134 domain-containing protein [Bacillota bacterium]
MARPEKSKRVCVAPSYNKFFSDSPVEGGEEEILTIEQFETVRLIDFVGLTQEQCAAQMNVARTTVQRMYTEARKKIACFLIKGCSLSIDGGNYRICEHGERCCRNAACPRMTCGCDGEFDHALCESYQSLMNISST